MYVCMCTPGIDSTTVLTFKIERNALMLDPV